jgi:hypothetical protein
MRFKYISALLAEESDATLTGIRQEAETAMGTIEKNFTASSASDIEKVIAGHLPLPNGSLVSFRPAVCAMLLRTL